MKDRAGTFAFQGPLQLLRTRKLDAFEVPPARARYSFDLRAGFGEGDIHARLAVLAALEQKLKREGGLADAGVALKQVEATGRQAALRMWLRPGCRWKEADETFDLRRGWPRRGCGAESADCPVSRKSGSVVGGSVTLRLKTPAISYRLLMSAGEKRGLGSARWRKVAQNARKRVKWADAESRRHGPGGGCGASNHWQPLRNRQWYAEEGRCRGERVGDCLFAEARRFRGLGRGDAFL